EDRRRYIETVLEAITTGVVSLDALGRITTLNRAAARMFGVAEAAAIGRLLEEVFTGPEAREVVTLVQRTRRPKTGTAAIQLHMRRGGVALSLLASATALRGPEGAYDGAVVVFDDLTELLKAQRLAAWREVAQRIAHEIKNPLTPIQLSAQRLRRRLSRVGGDDAQLVTECTDTIIQEVDALKRMGDEVSRFARMPAFLPYFSTKVTGMGLGLPIVSEIVNEHGGIIRVEDNQPSGTRFVIEVPVTRAPAPVGA